MQTESLLNPGPSLAVCTFGDDRILPLHGPTGVEKFQRCPQMRSGHGYEGKLLLGGGRDVIWELVSP